MKRHFIWLSVLLIICMCAASCTSGAAPAAGTSTTQESTGDTAAEPSAQESTGDAAAEPPAETSGEGIEVTMLVTGHPVLIDWSTNSMSKYMEEHTGIKVNYKTIPQTGQLEALSLELSSGDYPDAFNVVGMNVDLVTRYGVNEGRLLAINDLIDEHAPNLKQIFADNPGYEGIMTMTDGNIYTMPEVNQCQHCSMHNKLWINVDFLDAVGLEMPTNTDELLTALRAFRDNDPNGNGLQDEIPFIGASRDGWGNSPEYFIMNAFTFYDADLLAPATGYTVLGMYRENDTIKVPWANPETIEGLKYMRTLAEEGLLYEGAYTADTASMVNLVQGGDVPTVGMAAAGHGYIYTEVGSDRYAQFRGVMPLEGPNGHKGIRKQIYDIAFNGFYVSADTPYAAEMVEWADFLYEWDTSMNGYFGPEGTHWRRAEEGEIGLDDKPALYKVLVPWNETEPHNDHWIQQTISYRNGAFRAGEAYEPGDPDAPAAFEKRLYDTTAEMEQWAITDMVMPPVKFTVEQNNTISIPMTDLNNLVKQYIPGFITGTYDIDTEYETFLQTLDSAGLPLVLETYQAAYDQQWAGK